MENRLLKNMQNKVSIIDGAIDQCERLINNETVVLKGLHTLNITKGNLTDEDLNLRISELQQEKSGLLIRINRINKSSNTPS